jgi:cytochrome c oxidase subunit II
VNQPSGGSLDPQGPVAETIANLWWVMLALGAAIFLLVVVLLGVGLFRERKSAESESEAGEGPFRSWLLGGGIVLPVVVLVIVLVATIIAMRNVGTDAPSGALRVEIIGHQWWWEIRYPDEGITTANELHIPVGRPIALQVTSADVIHSFWVPRLAGKIDLLPEGTNTLVMEANEPGEHRSECAEFCGLQHAQMALIVVAEPADRFASWVTDQRRPAAEPPDVTAELGAELVVNGDCASCHAIRGTSADGNAGPDLTHFASRPTIGAGAVRNTSANLARWIENPHAIKDGVKMPAPELSDEQFDAVLAYLETLE